MEINEIDEEINRLNKLRNQYHNEKLQGVKEELLKLEWLKDVAVVFYEEEQGYGVGYSIKGLLPSKFKVLGYNGWDLTDDNPPVTFRFSYNELSEFIISSYNIPAFIKLIQKYVGKISSYRNLRDLISLHETVLSKSEG